MRPAPPPDELGEPPVRWEDELEPPDGCPLGELDGRADEVLLPVAPGEPEVAGRWLLDPADGLLAGRPAEEGMAPAKERPVVLDVGRLAFDAAGRDAGRALIELLALVPREAFEELRFFAEALREPAPRFAGDFARLLAAVDRFLLVLREVDAARDFEAELRDATLDFDELRPALAPRLLDFFAALREEPDRPAEAFFELEPARPRLDAPPADPLDELPERPEDLEEPRLLDAITTPFDVSALSERIDR